jgi:N-methylhydantoinase B
LEELPACADIILKPGETVVSYCTGGGGYGPPIERPAAQVKYDVDEGWISKERAFEIYGVVFGNDGSLDEAATAQRRRELAGA